MSGSRRRRRGRQRSANDLSYGASLAGCAMFVYCAGVVFRVGGPPECPTDGGNAGNVSMLPFLRGPVGVVPSRATLRVVPVGDIRGGSSKCDAIPDTVDDRPSPVPATPSMEVPVDAGEGPIPARVEASKAFLLLCVIRAIPRATGVVVDEERAYFFLVSVRRFVPEGPDARVSFAPFVSVCVSPTGFDRAYCVLPFPGREGLLPILPGISTRYEAPSCNVYFPIPWRVPLLPSSSSYYEFRELGGTPHAC